MRQGTIIFADAAADKSAEAALRQAVEAAKASGAAAYVAYGEGASSEKLRAIIEGPPPRFFPQAARSTLGERIAQAFAFLFVQDFERVVLVTRPTPKADPGLFGTLLAGLDDAPVVIEALGDVYAIALRRADFPSVAPIFEEVAWETPGAKERAGALLASESGAR